MSDADVVAIPGPTVALVHGAFADSSSWNGVVAGLLAAAVPAATQRPVSATGFTEPNGAPAWKGLPSWAIVATGDHAAGADVVRSMAQRAGADIVEAEGSHVIMISQPRAVIDVIMRALQ